MHRADVMELFGHDVLREFGLVAFAAQVGEVKVAQVGGHDLRGGFGGGFVGQMAVAAEDALLEAPRAARTILQHLHVMVGFEDEDVRGADAVEHQLGDVAEVGGKTEIAGGGAQQKSDRILRVVRNGKRFDAHIADFKSRAVFKQSPVNFLFQVFRAVEAVERGFFRPFGFERPDGAVLRAAIAIDRDVKFVGDAEQSADVVGVFVRDENGGQVFRRAPDAGEALADLARRKPGVHEHAGFGGFEVGAIAAGTAAEDGEFDGHALHGNGGKVRGQILLSR